MEIWFGLHHKLPYFKSGGHGYYFASDGAEAELATVSVGRGWSVDNKNTQDYPLVRNLMFNWE